MKNNHNGRDNHDGSVETIQNYNSFIETMKAFSCVQLIS